MIFPVVVAAGSDCSGTARSPPASASAVSTSGTGVVMATYDKAGEVSVGSFALDQPTDLELQRREKLRSQS